MMNHETITSLTKIAKELRAKDIGHTELGTTSGFQEAEQHKNFATELLCLLAEQLLAQPEALVGPSPAEAIERLRQRLQNLAAKVADVDTAVKEGVHDPAFPKKRTNLIRAIASEAQTIQSEATPIQHTLRLSRVESAVTEPGGLQEIKTNAMASAAVIDALAKEATKILSNIRDRVAIKGFGEAGDTFKVRRNDHHVLERRWLWAFGGCAILAVCLVIEAAVKSFPTGTTTDLVEAVIQRLLLVSLAAAGMRVTLSKYNLERNLRILYAHRVTVLEQFRTFEAAIGDDMVAKNQFRLEVARMVFSDPATGYVSADTGSEININPITGVLEKAVTQRGPS